MIKVTNRLSAQGIRELARLGVEAIYVYVEVNIDGVVVLDDPLEVFYWYKEEVGEALNRYIRKKNNLKE